MGKTCLPLCFGIDDDDDGVDGKADVGDEDDGDGADCGNELGEV